MSSLSGKIKSLNYKMLLLAMLTDVSLPDLYQKPDLFYMCEGGWNEALKSNG